MKINAGTKIDDLLKEYPFLLDFLITQSPKFESLKSPTMRKTMGKVATLKMAAKVGKIDLDHFISSIVKEVESKTGESLTVPDTTPESILDEKEKQEVLKGIIKDLHRGEDMEVLKNRFRKLIQNVKATEIAQMEQQLMDEGLPPEEIKKLCDVHVEIFKEALEEKDRPECPPGHPVHTFMKENRASEKIMSDIHILIGRLGQPPERQAFVRYKDELDSLIERLSEINIHYLRKENQLFPLLEAHHFTGPSQVMWAIHDDIRGLIKKAKRQFSEANCGETVSALKEAIATVRDMIFKEEHILFPASLDMLSESEWLKAKEGETDIGYAWVGPDEGWPPVREEKGEPIPKETYPSVAGALGLDAGAMTIEQINLLLTHLPVDLTFVDENDKVAYYSEGKERIFPRSPGIIGREVRNCHPPKSVHLVNKILDSFKSGSKDSADFWIEMGGKFIYIRYFAVRDSKGEYKGTLEVSQDLTDIRKLTGEQRLLDWD